MSRVEALEARIGCRRPEQYRRFVTELSDGGIGPGVGIRRLEDAIDAYRASSFSAPPDLGEAYRALPICRYVYPAAHWLALTGPSAGCIWDERHERFAPALLLGTPDDSESPVIPDQDVLAMWVASPRDARLEFVDWLAQELDDRLLFVACKTPDRDDVFERPPAQATDVNLRARRLTEVPGELRRMTATRDLDLSANPIEELPEWIGELVELEHLKLGGTRLRRLPESFGDLRALSTLDIYETRALEQRLPASVKRLPRLESIWASGCGLGELPDNIGELSVAELDLFNNELVRVPASIGRMRLHTLTLGANRLTELPDELEQLDELTTLDLSDNLFAVLPDCVARLPRLERLELESNDALDLADACRKLQHVRTLRCLSLSTNLQPALPDEIGLLTRLESLDLHFREPASHQHAPLLDIAGACRALQHVPTLRRLSLSSNQRTALPDEIGLLTQLESLDLRFRELTALPSSLARLTRLRSLAGVGVFRARMRELLPHLYGDPPP